MAAGGTLETLLNGALADLLRQQGLEAEAEQMVRDRARHSHRVDVLVELQDSVAAIEAEFAPARTVVADARKRLPAQPLYWRGLPVTCAFALVYPDNLKTIPESRARAQLETCKALQFSQLFPPDPRPNLFPAGAHQSETTQTGSVTALAECLHAFWIHTEHSGGVEDTVRDTSEAIARASAILGHLHPRADDDSDRAATSALIWLNALLFQELLAQNLSPESLPPEHRGKRIPPPDPDGAPDVIRRQWREILAINWWPIFHFATEALAAVPARQAKLALAELRPVARTIAERGVIRRHDIAGRIFHRLLDTRKFLATNYTTIPAAVLLAGLAFDREASAWTETVWDRPEEIGTLRIVDPACGSGTLLMAAVQEVLKRHRRAADKNGQPDEAAVIRTLLEDVIHGYDVVPAAIHLTAATLAMAETRQIVNNNRLYWMPHDVNQRPRLGSLDFLARSAGKGQAHYLPMFPDATLDPDRRTGTGERKHDTYMPECDLVIANPPYTRAGGPGSVGNTDWNPIFGSVLSKADADRMQQALQRTLQGTPASTYAGLGSAFLTLADERLKRGGRLAFVLPATALTGSRWAPIRELLLDKYDVEWVVVSHDDRTRSVKGNLPGRLYVGFSESTRMAETLIVATKKPSTVRHDRARLTRFVNLRRNPDEPIAAMAIVRALLALKTPSRSRRSVEVSVGSTGWGEMRFVLQRDLDQQAWPHAAFVQGRLTETALTLRDKGTFRIDGTALSIPIARMGKLCELGPYEMQIKNPKQGLFTIVETDDPIRVGHPALWHHGSNRITTLEVGANARLHERDDQSLAAQEAMLARRGRLHIARELRHAPQRLSALLTNEPMLGVRSWITVTPMNPSEGKEEALCLWLNSTPGLLLRLIHANRPYLGRSALPHELVQTLPVLNIDRLSRKQRRAARKLFTDLKGKTLQGFSRLADDPVRREPDHRLFADVFGHEANRAVDALAKILNREPTMTTRH